MLETETDFWESIKSKLLHIEHCSSFTLLLIRTFSLHYGVLVSKRLLHFRTKVENRMAPQVSSTWNLCNKQVSAVPRRLQQTNEESRDPQMWLVLKYINVEIEKVPIFILRSPNDPTTQLWVSVTQNIIPFLLRCRDGPDFWDSPNAV